LTIGEPRQQAGVDSVQIYVPFCATHPRLDPE
jgi:hypothetical protein